MTNTENRASSRKIPLIAGGLLVLVAVVLLVTQPLWRSPPVWLAYGDSLTTDTIYDNGQPVAAIPGVWPEKVAAATGIRIINTAVGGATTEDAVHHLHDRVLAHEPDLVLIMFGINDQRILDGGRSNGYLVPPARFRKNLLHIVTKIQETGAEVALMTNRPLVEGPGAPENTYFLDANGDGGDLYALAGKTKTTIRIYNRIIREVATQRGAHLIDIWQALVDQAGGEDSDEAVLATGIDIPPPHTDGVHLGEAGHRFIADTVLATEPFRTFAATHAKKNQAR